MLIISQARGWQRPAWTLRLSADKLVEHLLSLAEVGVVHEAESGVWFITHFKERQTSESYERIKRYRECYRKAEWFGKVAEESSTSTSSSDSDSVSAEEGGRGGGTAGCV